MGELKRVPFVLVTTLMIVGMCVSPGQGAPRPQPPGYSAQQEKERIEAAVHSMRQPDARRERQLRDELGRVLLRWRTDRTPFLREECESLLKAILALPKPTATAYSSCAATASVLGLPRQAIDIVEQAIAEYPDEKVGGISVPLRISGRFRIAGMATRIGDVNEAMEAYESTLGSIDNLKGRETYEFLCHMYLADILRGVPAQAASALARRLDTVGDKTTQRRIIAMLGQIGPTAQDAVPVLTRYARHEDPNVRTVALRALRRISPTTVDQLERADHP